MSQLSFHRRISIISVLSGRFILSMGLVLGLAASSAWAQNAASGSISGQVTDPQGAAIAGAEIKIIDKATSSVRTYTSNEAGRYDILNINPGVYDVTIARQGFSESKLTNQKVEIGVTLNLNIKLQLGSSSTIVEVTAGATAELQTTNATVGSTVSGLQLESLPTPGRDANAFILLQPGVGPTGSVAGAVADQNTYQLDGGNNSSDMDGSQTSYTLASGSITGNTGGTPSGVMPTPIETIEEFKVGTAGQTADFNGSAGGQVQMVTKRGTNQYHGAVYDYLLSSYFFANSWKNDHTPSNGLPYTPIAKTHQNRYGASLGGIMSPKFWGGRTYFFFNYEARSFPQAQTNERIVPSVLLRAGVITLPNSAGVQTQYNLNPTPVTVNGVTYPPAVCPAGSCDPRGLGLNKLVSQVWSTIPLPNDPQAGDNYNTQGYNSNVATPQTSKEWTTRIDHDFGEKNHLTVSYRYFDLNQFATTQTNIAGGTQVSTAPRDQKPGYWVAGLTTTITPTLTNDFHYSYLRNFWQWGTLGAPPQIAGLGGALEIGGESGGPGSGTGANALIPYNVNAQSVRQRFWDGQDHTFRDDLSWVKGNHLFQFGGQFQRNYNFHQRDDNGSQVFNNTTYVIGGQITGLISNPNYIPVGLAASSASNFLQYYTEVLGIVSQPQTLYTRAGNNLALQPLGTDFFDQSIIKYGSAYFSDTWHMRKDLTLVYGLGYQLETPPYEINGKQVLLVDQAGNPITAQSYLTTKENMALQGQVYNPNIGFATIRNVATAPKYPYNVFYAGLSPRVAAAWNPSFHDGILGALMGDGKTVIRGGYSRVFGRVNGVAQVLVPLLGTGFGQVASCIGASKSGQCLGAQSVDGNSAFRIGTDGLVAPLPAVGQTLAQPYFPGQFGNGAVGDGSLLDANVKPNRSDVFTFSIQRQLSNKFSIEAGYIGRIIKNEFQDQNLDAVPIDMTLGGQSFANAFGNLYQQVAGGQAVQTQPFFEKALGGTTSAYCAGFASCTAAVASKQKTQITGTQVYNLWTAMGNSPSWTLGRTLPDSAPTQTTSIYMESSNGWGNYNAAYLSFTMRDWHGMTARSNFTWSRGFGTLATSQATSSETTLNPFNLGMAYGPQTFDIKFVYNLSLVYAPKVFMHSSNVVARTLLSGWNMAPLFTAQSGAPIEVNIGSPSDCQSFGEGNCGGESTYENAVFTQPYTQGNSRHENVVGTNGIATSGNASVGGSGLNYFANPAAGLANFRRLILGVDTNSGGAGVLRGLPTWNLDFAVTKDFKIPFREGMGLTFNMQASNVLNHFQPSNPSLNIDTPSSWGVITGQANSPRQFTFGLRLHF
jgi:hypothetical protein